MKAFLFTTAAVALLTGGSFAQGQFGGVVFDPTQSAHAIEQIAQGQQIFTNTVTLANNAIAAYNLAYQMSLAPQSLYEPYLSPSTYWMLLNQSANTYGNSQPVMDTANTGTNAQYSYQTGEHSAHRNSSRLRCPKHIGSSRTLPRKERRPT